MKVAVSFTLVILVILVGCQNNGLRYGSYAAFSWIWLVVSLAPIIYGMYYKKRDSKRYLIFSFFLMLVIFVQPLIKIHPSLILACSLIFIFLFAFFETKSENNILTNRAFQLKRKDVLTCRQFISENRLEDCFKFLLEILEDEKEQATVVALNQRWNKNKSDKNMNLNTNEWADIQESRVINELLNLLK